MGTTLELTVAVRRDGTGRGSCRVAGTGGGDSDAAGQGQVPDTETCWPRPLSCRGDRYWWSGFAADHLQVSSPIRALIVCCDRAIKSKSCLLQQ